MSDFDRADLDCQEIQKQHGPGGELPVLKVEDIAKHNFSIRNQKTAEKKSTQKAVEKEESPKADTKKTDAVDASWVPVTKPTEMDKLVDCTKHVLPISALAVVVFYWQQSGQLAEPAGYYALIFLSLLCGLTVGKYATK